MFEVVNCYRKFPLSKMAFQEMFIIKKCLNYLGGGAQITKSLIVRRQPPHLVCVCVCVCGGGDFKFNKQFSWISNENKLGLSCAKLRTASPLRLLLLVNSKLCKYEK